MFNSLLTLRNTHVKWVPSCMYFLGMDPNGSHSKHSWGSSSTSYHPHITFEVCTSPWMREATIYGPKGHGPLFMLFFSLTLGTCSLTHLLTSWAASWRHSSRLFASSNICCASPFLGLTIHISNEVGQHTNPRRWLQNCSLTFVSLVVSYAWSE